MKKILEELEDKVYLKLIDMKNDAKALLNKCNGYIEAADKFEDFMKKEVLVEYLGKYSNYEDKIKKEYEDKLEDKVKEIKNELENKYKGKGKRSKKSKSKSSKSNKSKK